MHIRKVEYGRWPARERQWQWPGALPVAVLAAALLAMAALLALAPPPGPPAPFVG